MKFEARCHVLVEAETLLVRLSDLCSHCIELLVVLPDVVPVVLIELTIIVSFWFSISPRDCGSVEVLLTNSS